jgi:hypothetical protein
MHTAAVLTSDDLSGCSGVSVVGVASHLIFVGRLGVGVQYLVESYFGEVGCGSVTLVRPKGI